MKTRTIASTGLAVTEIGLGCAPIAGLYQECSEETANATLELAWQSGIRYFDTAPFYGMGLSEERLGRFLQGKPRRDFVVSTKVGRLLRPVPAGEAPSHGFIGAHSSAIDYDYSRDGILRSVEASMKRTGLDRFDILFVHDIGTYSHGEDGNPFHMRALAGSGIAAMNELRDSGVVNAWGIGVNEVAICLDVLDRAHLDCILIAGRHTLLDRRAEERLLPLCAERGTSLIAGGVFNSGILATGPIPGAHFDYMEADADILDRVGKMQGLAMAADVELAAAAMQFPLQCPVIASVLIGAADPAIVARNVASLGRPVDPALYAACAPYAVR